MIDSIKGFFQSRMTPPDAGADADVGESDERPAIHVAACALLLELAYADDEFSDIERRHIGNVVQRHFGLDEVTTEELVAVAHQERARAVDLFQFTSLIASGYTEAQKMVLLEAMWGLVFADGQIARHETAMMRRISKLLDVRPGFLADARRRVEAAD